MLQTGQRSKSEWLKGDIFDKQPKTWRDLQEYVAQVFREVGYLEVQTPYKLVGVRITKEVDVYAVEASVVPPIKIACECKHWASKVPQAVVLEFRSVLEDSGLNRGFIISKVGFQSPGAFAAARNTPIVLTDFKHFMGSFFDSWLTAMSIRLDKASNRVFPFFDPYYFETLPELPRNRYPSFAELREKYRVFASLGTRIRDDREPRISWAITARNPELITPLKKLGILSCRQFFDTLLAMADQALLDFCSLFGVDP